MRVHNISRFYGPVCVPQKGRGKDGKDDSLLLKIIPGRNARHLDTIRINCARLPSAIASNHPYSLPRRSQTPDLVLSHDLDPTHVGWQETHEDSDIHTIPPEL